MPNAELFIHLAEIAGVFVAFGALIAVRSGGPTDPREVAPIRGMVSFGVVAIVGGLAPVTLGFFDAAEHLVWWVSSAVVLVGLLVIGVAVLRTPEWRAWAAVELEASRTGSPSRSRWLVVLHYVVLNALYTIALLVLLVTILLGVAPDLEAGLYFALVALILLGAAWFLLLLVFAQRNPEGE